MAVRVVNTGKSASEVHFWACFVVALALLTQIFFPPQVMAADTAHGTTFVLCTGGMDTTAIVDPVLAKAVKDLHKSGLQGLKCANCVLASITAIQTPNTVYVPAIYSVSHADFRPEQAASPPQARAPPRPFSCGPPALI